MKKMVYYKQISIIASFLLFAIIYSFNAFALVLPTSAISCWSDTVNCSAGSDGNLATQTEYAYQNSEFNYTFSQGFGNGVEVTITVDDSGTESSVPEILYCRNSTDLVQVTSWNDVTGITSSSGAIPSQCLINNNVTFRFSANGDGGLISIVDFQFAEQIPFASHYYPFNESSGNATDLLSGINGSVSSGVTQGVLGKIGTAYSFDGINGNVVLLPSIKITNFNYSIALWIKGNPQDDSRFFSESRDSDSTFFGLGSGIGTDNDKARLFIRDSFGTPVLTEVFSGIILDNTWHFIVLTRNESSLNYYLDGNIVIRLSNYSIDPWNPAKSCIASHCIGGGGSFFNGVIDEPVLLNFSLNDTQVSQLYNGGNGKQFSFSNIGIGQPESPPQIIAPTINFTSPTNTTYNISSIPLEYIVVNGTSCWFSNGTFNITLICGENYTIINITNGSHTFTLFANNTNGTASDTVTFSVNIPSFPPMNPPDNLSGAIADNYVSTGTCDNITWGGDGNLTSMATCTGGAGLINIYNYTLAGTPNGNVTYTFIAPNDMQIQCFNNDTQNYTIFHQLFDPLAQSLPFGCILEGNKVSIKIRSPFTLQINDSIFYYQISPPSPPSSSLSTNAVYVMLSSAGAGLGLFISYLGVPLAIFIFLIAVAIIIVIIGSGIAKMLERFFNKR